MKVQGDGENSSKSDSDSSDDDDDYDDDEFPPVHIKLPLQLDLDDIAGVNISSYNFYTNLAIFFTHVLHKYINNNYHIIKILHYSSIKIFVAPIFFAKILTFEPFLEL